MGAERPCLQFFAELIRTHCGIVYTDINYYQLESRLVDVARDLAFADVSAMWHAAAAGRLTAAQRLILIDRATNNETSFFRDPKVFRAICQLVNAPRTASAPFQIWSAACSTGQELYSLAITLDEQASPVCDYRLLATDISERALRRAEAGVYSQLEVQRGLEVGRMVKYFQPVAEQGASSETPKQWMVDQNLRRHMRFKRLNLLEQWGAIGPFDLILCRNVLIYQTVETRQQIVRRLIDHLAPGGHLILGSAESLFGIDDQLEGMTSEGVLLYRKRMASAA